MNDYYTTNELAFSDAWYRQQGRIIGSIFAFRKAIGWGLPPNDGRRLLQSWNSLDISALPPTLQQPFLEKIQIARDYQYNLLGILRSDTIGNLSQYAARLISHDWKTTWDIIVMRVKFGDFPKEIWMQNLRTDFDDGIILITECKDGLATVFQRPYVRTEIFPEKTPVPQIFSRHNERVSQKGRNSAVIVPETDIQDYLRQRAEADFQDLISSGYLRKLSPQEVARLQSITFDFA